METKIEKPGGAAAGGKRHNTRYQQKAAAVAEPKFEGRCKDINGFVFECANGKQAGRYNLATNKSAEYVERTYTY
jgi:hypothetical protein